MAEQQSMVVNVGGGQVGVFFGDLFDSDARVLVVPCSTGGGMSPEFKDRLDALGIEPPTFELEPGQVLEVSAPDSRRTIMLAAVVAGDGPTHQFVTEAARRVGELAVRIGEDALRPGGTVFPLLGIGAGGLTPENSLSAIAAGYNTALPAADLRIYVIDPTIYDRLRKLSPGPTFSPDPLPVGSSSDESPDTGRTSRARRAPSKASSTSKASSAPEAGSATDEAEEAFESDEPVQSDEAGHRAEGVPSGSARDELVPTHADGPASVDELGREGFARVLARRIRDARKEEALNSKREPDSPAPWPAWAGWVRRPPWTRRAREARRASRGGAFIVHLHAPWGAGKTSVLNFLAAELGKPDKEAPAPRSVVVHFNAWRHQRIEPPWWWLMTALYSGAVRDLSTFNRSRAIRLRLHEWYWRSKGGWPGYLALVAVACIVGFAWRAGWFGARGDESLFSLDSVKGFLVTAAAIVTPLLTVWGLLHAMGRWVFTSSARGARRFVANTSDPMRLVQEHLADLSQWIHHDVVVMIDDLDRCKGPYVVELLEGIQTLFRDIPVTYVIAADRDWLADSYAAEYAGFGSVAGETGRPVGYFFLEKTFQISTGLPQLGDRFDAFWGRILRSASVPGRKELEKARNVASSELGGLTSHQVQAEIIANPGRTPADVQARKETLAVQMVTTRALERTTHTLEPFRRLLGRDPNPRTMKRLVNAYGIARGIETLAPDKPTDNPVDKPRDSHLDEQETALWTILTLRWPRLASYLTRYPEHLAAVGPADPPAAVPTDLRPLFTDPEVLAVIQGDAEDISATITEEFLRTTPLR